MGKNDIFLVRYAVGKSTNLAKAWNRTAPWGSFCTELSTPVKTGESRAKFDAMTKDEQDLLKAINGWISTAQCADNKRNLKNVLPRNLLSLDIDYCEIPTMEAIAAGTGPLSQFESFTHSSRRHTARKPRLRQFFPLKREVDADEYHALVRIISWIFDGKREPIIQVDRVSARPAQMMFKPTISKDGDWFCHRQEGRLLDPDEIFALWIKKKGDPKDLSKLPLFDSETSLRRSAAKSENPLAKPGIIGAFCRAYRIEDAMEKFIPDAYIPGDAHSENPRFTYTGSTSSNGAIVYDDGLFLYSNHGHDPCCEQNVNAFDMVRLHKFGDLDEGFDVKETPVTQHPSYKAMTGFARADEGVRNELVQEQYAIKNQFEDESDEEEPEEDLIGDDSPPSKKTKKTKEKRDWRVGLETDKQGRNTNSIDNYNLILQNDYRLKGAIRYNEFTGQINLRRTIKSDILTIPDTVCLDPANGDRMADADDSVVRGICDAPKNKGGYGILNHIGNLRDAVVISARKNPFHPVKEYLESLEWDGKNRIDDYLIRHLKAKDSLLNHEMSRLTLLASVARIYEPGHKFDFITILEGPQGIRKSTFILELYGHLWFGELNCKLNDDKEIMEQTPGYWGMEIPELDSMKKADAPVIKKFMRKTKYESRMAYGHNTSHMLIQFIVWGSTNETRYLRDDTGLRTFWSIRCGFKKGEHIDTEAVRAERGQLFAEALVEYRRMRQEMPKDLVPVLPLCLSHEAEKELEELHKGTRLEEIHEELAARMLETADEPIRLSDLLREYGNAGEHFAKEGEIDPDTVMVRRCVLTRRDLIQFAYGERTDRLTDQVKKTNFDKAMEIILKKWDEPTATTRYRFNGKIGGRWYTRKNITTQEIALSYQILPNEDDDLIG